MMHWRRTNTCSFLFDENGKTMMTILKLPGDTYHITLVPFNERYQISAKSVEYAEWYAVRTLYDQCNQQANYFHHIRNNLPRLRDLAEKAGII